MKGTKVNEDPVVVISEDFHRKMVPLLTQVDVEIYSQISADYIEQTYKQGRPVDEVVAEATEKALRLQSKRQHRELCEYFNTAETVAARPGITVAEACHVMAKHYYLQHHQVKGEQQVLSTRYNAMYDSFYDQAQNRKIKSAIELFGE